MDRKISTMCSKCRERTVALVTIPYQIQIDHDGRKHQVSIPDLNVARCAKCGELYFDHESSEQVSRAFRKQVGLLQPAEIRQQRERLALSQETFAEMLGVEPCEIKRWENSEQIQPRHVDRFLRAFFLLPDLRTVLAQKDTIPLMLSDEKPALSTVM